ncbi:MAG: 50S ribosomal protein L4 [Victivallales bacterium]|nr:50S ribosomal protein L4 [Victivallales bacterium]
MANTLEILKASGDASGESVELKELWLERAKGEQAVKDSVVAFWAGLRAGTASTKTRGLVSGGGSKPWRQKGTGRARSGSSRSPVWRGGGIVFGPQPRSYDKKVNHKVEKLALRRAFTDRVDEQAVIVVDSIADVCDADKNPKTKKMIEFLKAIGAGDHALVLDAEIDSAVETASRNLPTVLVMKASSVNTYWMLRFDKVVITKAGLEALGERLG